MPVWRRCRRWPSSDYATPAELAKLLAHADESCAKPIVKALDRIAEAEGQKSGYDRPVRADLLIVVDQLDELFASEVSEAERARFAKLLAHLVATGRVWVIATLRADLYERFLKEPDLLAMKTQGRDLRSRPSRRHRDRRDHPRAGDRRRPRLRDRSPRPASGWTIG